MRVPSGSTNRYAYFVAVDATDLKTREPALSSFTVVRSRNGASDVTWTTPTIVEIDATTMPGVYALLIDEDTTLDAGQDEQEMCLHITHAGMDPVTRTIEIFRPKATEGQTVTASDSKIDGVKLVDLITAYTGNTPQTGDSFAIVSSGTFGNSAIKTAVDAKPTAAAIADAVWDEMLVPDHVVLGSAGGYMVVIDQDIDVLLVRTASGSALLNTPCVYLRPVSGNYTYTIEARVYNANGALVNADSTPTLTATGITSGSLAANLSVASNPSTGVYQWTYTVTSAATIEQIVFELDGLLSAVAFEAKVLVGVAVLPAVAGDVPTVMQIWTTALTEAYRATGATGTAAQLLYEILGNLTEQNYVGTTKTVKKLDGTIAKTYTMDSATSPTTITELF